MKKTYESFSEIASDFCNGDHWTHSLSDHTSEGCFDWQHGIYEFAKFLDEVGLKMLKTPKTYDVLWERIRTYKPTKVKEHHQ